MNRYYPGRLLVVPHPALPFFRGLAAEDLLKADVANPYTTTCLGKRSAAIPEVYYRMPAFRVHRPRYQSSVAVFVFLATNAGLHGRLTQLLHSLSVGQFFTPIVADGGLCAFMAGKATCGAEIMRGGQEARDKCAPSVMGEQLIDWARRFKTL